MDTSMSGIIENSPRKRDLRRRRRLSRRSTVQLGGEPAMIDGVEVDRLSYINTALEALPGRALRDYFVPVMRLKKNLIMRRKATRERYPSDPKALDKKKMDGLAHLVKSLTEIANDLLGDTTFPLDANAFVELLKDKVEPVSFEAGDTLYYPSEPVECLYVYIVITGSVRVMHYQPLRRATAASASGTDRRQYFTSNQEPLKLLGGGLVSENVFTLAAEATEGAALNNTCVSNANNDAVSNVTSAIQRSLKRVSRAVGQPTLQITRTDILRAPVVLGAAEALGLTPFKCATVEATTTAIGVVAPSATATAKDGGAAASGNYTDVLRVRALDVHAALLELATRDMEARRQTTGHDISAAWFSAPLGALPPRGVTRTIGDYIAAARVKALGAYYHQNEVLMRQSWLLQDTPPPTIRNLISHLAARTYMPGEVIACAHTSSSSARQLCFLRRGRIVIMETPRSRRACTSGTGTLISGSNGRGLCMCGEDPATTGSEVLEVIEAGASFGELSVLFGEPRNYVLRAATVCDVWCLSHNSFARTMRRDDALRRSLVEKAAALRMKWLGEQRFTPALADQLRAASELLKPLPDMVLRLVQERLEPVVYSPGTLVASMSERCGHMLFVIQGRITSICQGVASYGPGDIIGEGCLMPHRWPLGLSARTMVEGWKLTRESLIDALERADTLHAYSGEVTSQAQMYMKQIFSPPVPPVPTDVVGRHMMPKVPEAPGGMSYPEFAWQVAEVQLKATCYIFRDYVKWEDINYASMTLDGAAGGIQSKGRGVNTDALAREMVIARMNANVSALQPGNARAARKSVTASLGEKMDISAPSAPTDKKKPIKQQQQQQQHMAGSGRNVAKAMSMTRGGVRGAGGRKTSRQKRGGSARNAADTTGSARGNGMSKSTRRNNTGSSAFLVNAGVTAAPFASADRRRVLNVSGAKAAAGRSGADGLGLNAYNADGGVEAAAKGVGPLRRSASFVERSLDTLRRTQVAPPRITDFSNTLHERDRLLHTEARQEAALERQHGGTTTNKLLHRSRQQQQQQLQLGTAADSQHLLALITTASNSTALTVAKPSGPGAIYITTPAPVHIFLSSEPPRSEITMMEAISIGYVAQLPDTQHIQACVSFVDPDVTIGLPAHRARRYSMATTPNDRYHKHNFLFAASVFEDASKVEEQLHEERNREEDRKRKAQRLLSMMSATIEIHPDKHYRHNQKHTTHGDEGNLVPQLTEDTLGSPRGSAGTFLSPERYGEGGGAGNRHSGPNLSGPSTPSPFRGSPSRSPRKKMEAFARLLGRDSSKALDLLHVKYKVPCDHSESSPAGIAGSAFNGDASIGPVLEKLQEALAGGGAEAAPALAVAGPRDKWRNSALFDSFQQQQFSGSAASPLSGAGAEVDDNTILPSSENAAATAALARQDPLVAFVTSDSAVMFVERYGALDPPAAGNYSAPVVLGETGEPLENISSCHSSALRRRVSANLSASASAFDDATSPLGRVGGGGFCSSPPYSGRGGQHHSHSAALTPQDFIMPDTDDAAAMMRRIQRDVEGLNAVAKEQTRERARIRERQEQLGRHAAAVEAALAVPTMEEEQLLDDWKRAYRALTKDPLNTATIPRALVSQAGPDYVKHEIRSLTYREAEEARQQAALRGVEDWQQQVLDTKLDVGGGFAQPQRAKGLAAAKRVVATIGSSQIGRAAAPLTNPAQHLDSDSYQKWVADREQFFNNYSREVKHLSSANAAEPLLVEPLLVEPEFPSASAAFEY